MTADYLGSGKIVCAICFDFVVKIICTNITREFIWRVGWFPTCFRFCFFVQNRGQCFQRFTVGASRLHNTTGMSLNYAYMLDKDNRAAFTVSLGHAGDETAVRGSFERLDWS